MHIPPEFADYIVTKSHLTRAEQFERFSKMHTQEIEERATMLRNLRFDKETAKRRIKSYIRWGFDLFETPSFHDDVDSIVEKVYASKIPMGW